VILAVLPVKAWMDGTGRFIFRGVRPAAGFGQAGRAARQQPVMRST